VAKPCTKFQVCIALGPSRSEDISWGFMGCKF